MRAYLSFLTLIGIVFSAAKLSAQTNTVVPIGHVANPAQHRFVFGSQIFFIQAPPAGWNLLRVLPGSTVRMELAPQFDGATNIVWSTPSGSISTGTQNWLEINQFQSDRDGNYSATLQLNGDTNHTRDFELRTTPFDFAPIKNISSRTRISPTNPQLIAGFVVGREGTATGMKRPMVVRAVGPSLANFGVSAALADPELRIYDSAGNEVAPDPGWNSQTEIRIGWDSYEHYLRFLLNRLGAFPIPIPDPATDGPPGEPVHEYWLPPGSYTAVAKSASNGSGEVLLEVYESVELNPFEIFGWPTNVVPAAAPASDR